MAERCSRAFLVVQVVDVYWTKASRGAPGTMRCNAVPETLPLPACDDVDAART